MRLTTRTFSCKFMALLIAVMTLSACPGSDPIDPRVGTGDGLNEKNCTLQYEVTTPQIQTGSDPRIDSQWHLNNYGQFGGLSGEDLNLINVWPTNRGEGTRVAIIDDAIEVLHEDLRANIVPDASYNYRPARLGSAYPLPCSFADDHGTAVAGIIGARDSNAIGVAGVAPRASLVGYNALVTDQDADIADALGRDLNITGVYNNSWGAQDNGVLNPADNSFIQAIRDGIELGRSGKGAVYVFSAGNGGIGLSDRRIENSNYDGFVNKLGVIAACAIDNNGKRPDYGERGANMMVCGPSSNFGAPAISTIALQDNYRTDFSGTSASAPMVSGVVALMLTENPNLTWRDVQQILIDTARQNDPTDLEWTLYFGHYNNPQYGFGAVDAAAAVSAARNWASIGGSATLATCGPYTVQQNLPIPDAVGSTITPIDSTYSVNDCGVTRIEFIEVRLTTLHDYDGDLRVSLISPNGLISELASERRCSGNSGTNNCGIYADWPFGSVRHRDEPSTGIWTLQVADAQPGSSGALSSWSLTIYGR